MCEMIGGKHIRIDLEGNVFLGVPICCIAKLMTCSFVLTCRQFVFFFDNVSYMADK